MKYCLATKVLGKLNTGYGMSVDDQSIKTKWKNLMGEVGMAVQKLEV